jgi:copper chaperone
MFSEFARDLRRRASLQRYSVSGALTAEGARSVTRAIEALPEVDRALVDVARGEVTLEGHADEHQIRRAVGEAGFRLAERLPPPMSS